MTEWRECPATPAYVYDIDANKYDLYIYTIINGEYVNTRHLSKHMCQDQMNKEKDAATKGTSARWFYDAHKG